MAARLLGTSDTLAFHTRGTSADRSKYRGTPGTPCGPRSCDTSRRAYRLMCESGGVSLGRVVEGGVVLSLAEVVKNVFLPFEGFFASLLLYLSLCCFSLSCFCDCSLSRFCRFSLHLLPPLMLLSHPLCSCFLFRFFLLLLLEIFPVLYSLLHIYYHQVVLQVRSRHRS